MKTIQVSLSNRKHKALLDRAETLGVKPEEILEDLIKEHICETVVCFA